MTTSCPATIAFDFDSTIIDCETLDVLIALALEHTSDAHRTQILTNVRSITDRGMNGELALAESMSLRLQMAAITRREIEIFRQQSLVHITPGLDRIIADLRLVGHRVLIVSGGFWECIQPVADLLGFRSEEVFANTLAYASDGRVTSLAHPAPLATPDGKSIILRAENNTRRLMIGDGQNDIQTYESGAATDFIGFALHADRPYVLQHAPRYCRSVPELFTQLQELELLPT